MGLALWDALVLEVDDGLPREATLKGAGGGSRSQLDRGRLFLSVTAPKCPLYECHTSPGDRDYVLVKLKLNVRSKLVFQMSQQPREHRISHSQASRSPALPGESGRPLGRANRNLRSQANSIQEAHWNIGYSPYSRNLTTHSRWR